MKPSEIESINQNSNNTGEITMCNLATESTSAVSNDQQLNDEDSFQKEDLIKPRKGKNRTRIRILNYLDTLDEPLTASDISYNLNLDRRKTTSQLNILVRQNKIKVQRPLKHLGENFPSLYWRW